MKLTIIQLLVVIGLSMVQGAILLDSYRDKQLLKVATKKTK